MNENEIVNIIIDFLFTSFLFMIVPIIIFFTGKKDFSKEQIKRITIINSIVVFVIFIILFIILKKDLNVLTGLPAFFYGYVNYKLLSKHIKEEKYIYPNEEQEDEELENLIKKLENENMKN